ncbi:MAG: hypothetical protein H7338_15890 [Candidatus Sericytochromatia bacterium]|nr:hypothetical protein [Candidatus Sericytochromatia bacterium]
MARAYVAVGLVALIAFAACGRPVTYQRIAAGTDGAANVTLNSDTGGIRSGRNRLQLAFTDAQNKPQDVTRPLLVTAFGGVPGQGANTSASIQRMPPLTRTGTHGTMHRF